ncbi:hypothetical protein AAD001_09315 [Colwelliaceae bacterium 6471]
MFEHVLVIPAYKEDLSFIKRYFESSLARLNVLIILVINQPETDENKQPQVQLHRNVLALGTKVWQQDNLSLLAIKQSNTQILLVDRFTFAIPVKQGVGLARKVGCDLAASLINQNLVQSPWIHSSDADTQLPDDYFNAPQHVEKNAVAGCYNFIHQSNDAVIDSANQQYEHALRYYVNGLRYAGSHYAFFTIGSILTFNVIAYAKVRGFPKRSAGEDFYLLNKLAKLGQVAFFEKTTLVIEARTSDRVPFGTGPAVSKIIALNAENKPYCYYHPDIFDLLKQALTAFKTLWGNLTTLDNWYAELPDSLVIIFKELDLHTFIDKHQTSTQGQFNKQLIVWFDAFKTLKFIHSARDHFYPDIALDKAIAMSSFSHNR